MPSLTKVFDLTAPQAIAIIERAEDFKRRADSGERNIPLAQGAITALVFEKPSLRTKVAFEVAAYQLGGHAVFLSSSQILASGGNEHGRESVGDIAKNLERFADIIVARVFDHLVIEEMAASIKKPVVNALCNLHHPTQALADVLSLRQGIPKRPNDCRIAFIGDGNNVARSLMDMCALLGYNFVLSSPADYRIPEQAFLDAQKIASSNGATITWTADPIAAARGSDAIYTDTVVSMGQEKEAAVRRAVFADYQVNQSVMAAALPSAIFLHCLPAHRGEEVTDCVMDGPQSRVFDQAEWRLYVAKAVICRSLGV